MSQAKLGQGPRRGSDVVVLVSASHTRICGPAAAEHELRNAGAAAIAAPPSSRRRLSYDMGQLTEDAVIAEEGHGPNFECDIDFSVDEQGVTPVVRLVHHGPSSYLEMIEREAHASRHAVSPQPPMLMSRSPSPQSRSASPFTRPPTPIARPLSPKFRVMSPQQAARLSSFRATTSSIIRNPMSPRSAQQAQVCRYASQKQSRSGSWHHGRSLPSSRPQSGTTLVKIMEDCRLCAKKRKAMDERRGEATDVARSATSGSSRSPSAAAAIVAAAASAAGIHLEAYGSELEPCLDCLEEFVRRERVKKGVASDTSVERKKGEVSVASAERPDKVDKKAEKHHHPPSPPPASNMKEVLKTTLSSDGSTTEIAVSTSTAVTEGTSAASTAHTSRPGHASPHGHHTSPHGHHTSPHGHNTSPPGHHTSAPGHHTSAPGHHTSTPGHNTSINSHTTPPGHHSSPPGHHTSPPGHNTTPPCHNTSAPGHRTSPHGHHSSQHGHASPHGHASQLGCTASTDSQSTVSTSAQSPAPYRCPVCHACKCCGTVPPNSRM